MFDFLVAGSETPTSIIMWGILYFMHFPDVTDKMRCEMQRVVGDDRLPSLGHQEELPYCRAAIAEVIRIKPVTLLVAPHSNTEDLQYKNYVIPKGSALTINTSSILHDPELFPEPELFNPSRFLDKDGNFIPNENLNWIFGAGD